MQSTPEDDRRSDVALNSMELSPSLPTPDTDSQGIINPLQDNGCGTSRTIASESTAKSLLPSRNVTQEAGRKRERETGQREEANRPKR
tara:strand:+ start:785 stop:1048 length:264 start_codon:yes stop_codon:yes gene_type:complete